MGLQDRETFTVAIQVFDEFEDVVRASWLEDVCRAVQQQERISMIAFMIASGGTSAL